MDSAYTFHKQLRAVFYHQSWTGSISEYSILKAEAQSRIKLLEARFKNKLPGLSLASLFKNIPQNMLCIKDHDYGLNDWALIIVYNLYYNMTMQQVTSSTSNLTIRKAKINLKVGP